MKRHAGPLSYWGGLFRLKGDPHMLPRLAQLLFLLACAAAPVAVILLTR